MSVSTPEERGAVEPYTALAAIYDVVMEHVDYEAWAEYTNHILRSHHDDPRTVLELGCGTGSFAIELQPLGRYEYVGTDQSLAMIRVARAKAELYKIPIQFEVADFTRFTVSDPLDVVILLYDGMNYLLETDELTDLFQSVFNALRPGGLFFFDQSTPANSVNNGAYFEDEGEAEGVTYVRHSRYDAEAKLHTTTFDIVVEGAGYHERHVQRAYDMKEVRPILRASGFQEIAAFDAFSTDPATERSERVHWLVRRPAVS